MNKSTNQYSEFRVESKRLSWKLDEALPFASTKDVEPCHSVYGHEIAKEALTFAIHSGAKGMNAYVRGINGSGRRTLVKQVLKEQQPKARKHEDFCYVHNFSQPNAPKLIVLKAGDSKKFKQMMDSFALFVKNDLSKAIDKSALKEIIRSIESTIDEKIDAMYTSLEKSLETHQMILAQIKNEGKEQTIVLPTYEGKPIDFKQMEVLIAESKISEAQKSKWLEQLPVFEAQLNTIETQVNEFVREGLEDVRAKEREFAQKILSSHLKKIKSAFDNETVNVYLDDLLDDFIDNVLHAQKEGVDPQQLYGVNVLFVDKQGYDAPVVFEQAPTMNALIGAVETEGDLLPYQRVNAGSLVNAHGGFLVLEIDEALSESGVWPMIMRILRKEKLDFVFEDRPNGQPVLITPDAIPLDIKVILVGNHQRYYDLSTHDSHFACYFKILADLDTDLPRKTETYLRYAKVISKVINKERLLDFDASAIKGMIEYGARISHRKNSLSTYFRQIMDIAREASFLAQQADKQADFVTEKDVENALQAVKRRHFSSANHFYNLLESGTIIIDTQGEVVGQINGLAVTSSGKVDYGFPARITATVSPGKQGLINIEDQAKLSGQIHTKGFHILGGLLRYLLRPNHPISFSASIAFEQSYGGIDGDSASGAEACCLLSAIAKQPIDQGLSMTGAIDQFGHIQAIGGVNEKIEGFFDSCQKQGELTGTQGVIIPQSNVDDLMLRDDVVNACEQNQFHIYAVDHVLDAFAILTKTASCKKDLLSCQVYQQSSSLDLVTQQISALYVQSTKSSFDQTA